MTLHRVLALALIVSACSFDHGYEPDAPPNVELTVEFDGTATTADEASGTLMIPVTLSGVSTQTVTVDYAVGVASTAQRPDDFELLDGQLELLPGQTQATISVKIEMDMLEETDEDIVVTLTGAQGAVVGTRDAHTVTISADILPRVSFVDVTGTSADEATSPSVEVRLSIAPKAMVTVELGVAGTASGLDRSVSDGQLITFMPTETSKLVPLGVLQDLLDEDDETIELSLRNPSPKLLLATTNLMHSHTINDDDPLPTVGFSAATSMTNENQAVDLIVQLSAASGRVVTVNYAVTGGTAGGGDATVMGAPGTVTFMPGQTTRMISIAITNDAIDETNETVIVTLSSPVNAALTATVANTLTINDDDNPPSVAFMQATQSVNEAMTTVNLSVQLSSVSAFNISVPFTVGSTSTADNPEDFTVGTPSALMIPAGIASATIAINVKTDTLDEANETIVVDLGTPTNATLGTITTDTLTINDDDAAPTVAFTSAGSMPNEGNNNITLTVQLSDISGQDVIVPFTIDATSTAVNPADYTISPASPVTIPAGSTSTTITIAMKEDTLDETDETVIVALDAPTNATLGTPATYTLTIRDDDNPPDVSWNPAESNASDPEETHPPGMQTREVTFTLVLTAASGLTVTVPLLFSGIATLGVDYKAPAMVTFAPGATTASVVLVIERDAAVELDETITMTIDAANVVNAGTASPTVRSYTLQNDD
ncbi:MAG TPA: Calx-beta domain-containing protein [Kofleriaceae bacterium]